MKIFPFTLRKVTDSDLDPTATGSYPEPLTEAQIAWTPEDGVPAGDEPLVLPESENPYGLLVSDEASQ